jgi:tellurite resistance protein TerC
LIYLSTGLALILAFIGAKLILHFAHSHNHDVPEISTGASLLVIILILVVTVLASAAALKRDPSRRAYAGSIVRSHRRELTSADPDQPRRSGSSD